MLLALLVYSNKSYSDYENFRSVGSGSWTSGATWELSTDGGFTWFTSGQYPNENSNYTELRGGHNITVPVNTSVTCNQVTIRSGATLTILSGGTVTTISDGSFYDLNLESGSTVTGPGFVQTTGIYGGINISTGCNFLAPLKVISGVLYLFDAGSTLYANVKGDITVNSGTTLYTYGYLGIKAFGNVLNNGTITGYTPFTMRGNSLVNNGTINTPYLNFDTTTTISGVNGNWNSQFNVISSSGNVNCGNDINITGGGSNSVTTIKTGGKLDPKGHIVTFTGSPATCNINLENLSTIGDSGTVVLNGTVNFDIQTGANFKTPLKIISGTTNCFSSISPFTSRVNNSLTIDSGATLTCSGSSVSYNVTALGTVTNNGSITGFNFIMKGNTFINNGTIDSYTFNFDSTTALTGSGKFLTSNCRILSGANVTLASGHQFRNLDINAGGSLDITSKILKLNGPGDPVVNNGILTTAGSTIEYNGTFTQYFPQLNIDYVNVNFNNPYGFEMYHDASVKGLVQVLNGDVNLNTRNLTLQPSAALSETPGNTFKGDYGYIITTRNLNAPDNLNVGGMGAIITTSTNMGSTIIKRGHSIQNLPNGKQSVQRYFEITPSNNNILNGSIIYKYDDSELNGLSEPNLALYKSTNSGSSYNPESASLNTSLNTISISGITAFSKYTAGERSTVNLNLTAAIEGFYNASASQLNTGDTVRVYLRNATTPFLIIDSAKGKLNAVTLIASLTFPNASSGNYYIEVKHRNSIETWSAAAVTMTSGIPVNYDFTNASSQAFGNNLKQVDASPVRFAVYSGDVNQDGAVDLSDITSIYNNSINFLAGYVATDVTGDNIVDLSDLTLTYNNAGSFVSLKRP